MGAFSSNAVTGSDTNDQPLGAAKAFGLDSVQLGVAAGLYAVGESMSTQGVYMQPLQAVPMP